MPGFPRGITGDAILRRMTEQAQEYGAVIEPGAVGRLSRESDGFVAMLNGREVRARAVLLATGVMDHHPDLPGVERAIERAVVRICPICDGYEASDRSVAVIGRDDMGAREAAFLRTFSERVTLIHVGPPDALTANGELDRLGIELVRAPIDNVRLERDRVTALSWGGTFRSFDLVYSALGTSPNSGLADALGARLGDDGRLLTDAHQKTSIDGFYAAGDVVRGLNQIAVATAEAAIAATAIHNALREKDDQAIR
jgi:thioredoxin reductase (NADPH)